MEEEDPRHGDGPEPVQGVLPSGDEPAARLRRTFRS
jgi:hypothetical protein